MVRVEMRRAGREIAPDRDWGDGDPGDDVHEMDVADIGSPVQDGDEGSGR